MMTILHNRRIFMEYDPNAKQIGRVRCLHWQEGLSQLGLLNP